jgi:hypothetical protein
MRIGKDDLNAALRASMESSGIKIIPLLQPGEFKRTSVMQILGTTSKEAADSYIAQMVAAGKWEKVGDRRSRHGGQPSPAYAIK